MLNQGAHEILSSFCPQQIITPFLARRLFPRSSRNRTVRFSLLHLALQRSHPRENSRHIVFLNQRVWRGDRLSDGTLIDVPFCLRNEIRCRRTSGHLECRADFVGRTDRHLGFALLGRLEEATTDP